MMKKLFSLAVLVACLQSSFAQYLTPEQYIEKYRDLAIREMKRMGVPASITLAQGLLETENGNSVLLKKSNNHFGIKCKSSWSGNGVSHDDDAIGECFRTYKSDEESYRDHSNFLRGNGRYAALFDLDPADYKAWAYGLKKAGYATNPKYPAMLIKSIETYNLQQYSLAAIGDMPKYDRSKFEDDKEVPFVYVEEPGDAKPIQASYSTGNIPSELSKEQVTSINNIKCIMASKGTSLLAIATRHDIPLSKLMEINDLKTEGLLEKDQPIYLQKKAESGRGAYITKKGETLYDVAQQQGIQLASLANFNQLTPNTVVKEGTQLWLQSGKTVAYKQDATPTLTRPADQVDGNKYHTVQPKEGLYGISKKYGITVQQLKDWNNLSTDNLAIGQQLIVSKK